MIIKPTSLTVTQLLASSNEQYVVPSYQRRYSWKVKQLAELWNDIGFIEGSDHHLLGSIVCLAGHHTVGINKLEVVDGQQRLTTICMLLHCIKERLERDGDRDEVQEIDRLLLAKTADRQSVNKIALDSLDALEFQSHCKNESLEKFHNIALVNAFSTLREWVEESELPDLRTFLYRLTNQAIVIRLDVSDAKDAFKLFETINNRGLRLSPTDIIKNFILGNSARFSKSDLDLARKRWGQITAYLDGINSEAFFRHFLCAHLQKRITASHVIHYFKQVFMREVFEAAKFPEAESYAEEEDYEDDEAEAGLDDNIEGVNVEEELSGLERMTFAEFLNRLVKSAKTYREIALGCSGIPKIDHRLRNLRMIRSLQTYGFLMAIRTGGCSDDNFEKILKLTESFLMRHHICRGRGNETETAFASLCGVDPTDPLPEVEKTYRKLSPSDNRFKTEFSEARFVPALIDRARYCLEQFEALQHGNHLELQVSGTDLVHVEHIIPQKIKGKNAKKEFGDWPTYLGVKSDGLHPKFVSRIGNLSLLAGPLNIGASNSPYGRKKTAYSASAIQITKQISAKYSTFKFSHVEARSVEFAKLAVEIWPIP
jgi:hypothetical protein